MAGWLAWPALHWWVLGQLGWLHACCCWLIIVIVSVFAPHALLTRLPLPPCLASPCRGRPLDELWRVARGEWKYGDFLGQYGYLLAPQAAPANGNGKAVAAAVAAPAAPRVDLPQDLVNVQAYLLWEQAGQPDGADFGGQAREVLEKQVRAGASIADLERLLRGPPQQAAPKAAPAAPAPKKAAKEGKREKRQEVKQEAPPPPPPAPTSQPVVGQSMGMRARNPLDLIHRTEEGQQKGVVAKEKKYVRTPLTPLLEAALEDPKINWHRVGGS